MALVVLSSFSVNVTALEPIGSPPQGKISKGYNANITRFPHSAWIVHFLEDKDEVLKIKGFGGASLIKPNWIVTAAHVLARQETDWRIQIKVILGVDEISQEGFITEIEWHMFYPFYKKLSRAHDIGIARLRQIAPMSERIQPTLLPFPDEEEIRFRSKNAIVWLSGFGVIAEVPRDIGYPRLRSIDFKLHSRVSCDKILNNLSIENRSQVLCVYPASPAGGGACPGDSGSGLVGFKGKGNHSVILGVTAFGSGMCDKEHRLFHKSFILLALDPRSY